ncbi:M48 family metalloprotease [Acidithiobacillus ferrivorans]|nr:M48 family metalloprotease [Acidithiobacillus ferrivorans]
MKSSDSLKAILNGMVDQLGMRKHPRLMVTRFCDGVGMSILGTILIHPKALSMPESVQRYVLAHELGHYRHRDSWNLFLSWFSLVVGSYVLWVIPETHAFSWLFMMVWEGVFVFGLGSYRNRQERRANQFAAELIGRGTVLDGIRAVAGYMWPGKPLSKARVTRIKEVGQM